MASSLNFGTARCNDFEWFDSEDKSESPCYSQCVWMRPTSWLRFRQTRRIKLSEVVRTISNTYNRCRIPNPVLFFMLMNRMEDIIMIPKDPVYQSVRAIWFRGQFWSAIMNESPHRVQAIAIVVLVVFILSYDYRFYVLIACGGNKFGSDPHSFFRFCRFR